jgi:uncharacterized protein YfaQ (DUF2300 family)
MPPGHLGAWLNQHPNSAEQEQEAAEQSGVQSSSTVAAATADAAVEEHRTDAGSATSAARLAWAENLEHMSPQEREKVNESSRQLRNLPADRQALMKNAFRDLDSVPPDQRQIVVNSARYQSLSNLLKAEPYQPPK